MGLEGFFFCSYIIWPKLFWNSGGIKGLVGREEIIGTNQQMEAGATAADRVS